MEKTIRGRGEIGDWFMQVVCRFETIQGKGGKNGKRLDSSQAFGETGKSGVGGFAAGLKDKKNPGKPGLLYQTISQYE